MRQYTVRQLAKLAGVSVRTLHHYDELGLLKPSIRTEAKYRLYGPKELIRLQQILFYKELDFALVDIRQILEDPNFDVLTALHSHKQALQARRDRLSELLVTIDKTISTLNGEQTMLTDDELYQGFSKEQANAYRQEAAEKYGREVVEESENKLRGMSKEAFARLGAESKEVALKIANLMHLEPTDPAVQQLIARHYAIIRQFWGDSVGQNGSIADAYKGLAQTYVYDLRYTASYTGEENPAYAAFISKAMIHFADTQLK
ncbi:transcriptional activator Mta [Nibrella saemangeumensis]|uniref:Transcriptional activator Mta n=1 Tax=Nibrella saemangeumensis TaxID=1084526 RepID=A0ABP8MTL0_9BACT